MTRQGQRGTVSVVLLVTIVLAVLVAPARARQDAATGHLSGTVRDQAGDAVRLANVRLEASTGTRLDRISDENGRFAFDDLPAGIYTLTAAKAAFITNAWGAKRPGRPGTPLVLGQGDAHRNLDLTLPRGGVITGVVRDVSGRPAAGVEVATMPLNIDADDLGPDEVLSTVLTDDLGVYRIFGLAPGAYHVVAALRMPGLGPVGAPAAAEIDAVVQENRAPSDLPPVMRSYVPSPTYHPGTGRRDAAAAVEVDVGEVRAGVDIALALEPAASVRGRVSGPAHVPLEAVMLSLTPAIDPPPMQAALWLGLAGVLRPGADGRFELPPAAPGEYVLRARTFVRAGPNARSLLYWAEQRLDLAGYDLGGLNLALQPGLPVAGRVAFNGGEVDTPAPGGIRITLTSDATALPSSLTFQRLPNRGTSEPLSPAGAFRFSGVSPDVYEVSISGLNDTWWPLSAVANGRDALDFGLDVAAPVDDLVVTITRANTALQGTLTAAPGVPASGYFIVVFPADRRMWLPHARRIRATRPADDGTYGFDRLPPGDYLLAALTDIEDGEWNRPGVLEQLLPASQPVTVGNGETQFDIRIARSARSGDRSGSGLDQ